MNQNKSENAFIWNNGGTYWLNWAPYDPAIKHPRIRQTLGTRSVEEARARRDLFICDWDRRAGE